MILNKFLVTLALCISINAISQTSKREEGIKLGLKVGLNLANFGGDIENNAIRTSIHFGMVSEIIISDKFSFQPELLYSGQGFKNESILGYSKEKYNYISLPLLAKYYVAKNLSIESGPQISFLISSKSKNNDGNTDISDTNVVDFGWNVGLGYEFKSGIFFQGRYNLGLTNVNAESNSDSNRISNSVFQISVGCLF